MQSQLSIGSGKRLAFPWNSAEDAHGSRKGMQVLHLRLATSELCKLEGTPVAVYIFTHQDRIPRKGGMLKRIMSTRAAEAALFTKRE